MAYIASRPDKNIIVVDTDAMTQAGKVIVQNGTDMGTFVQKLWNQLQTTELPDYLNQMVIAYGQARATEFSNLVQHRQQVGQLLQKASSLFEFNEQAMQTVFKGLDIAVTPNNTSSTIFPDLTPPTGFVHVTALDPTTHLSTQLDPNNEGSLTELDPTFDLKKLHQILGDTSTFGNS